MRNYIRGTLVIIQCKNVLVVGKKEGVIYANISIVIWLNVIVLKKKLAKKTLFIEVGKALKKNRMIKG
jgi:hypothetical protein